MSAQGPAGVKATKAEAREFARRTRASLRLADAALKRSDWAEAQEWAAQAAGDACEYQNVINALVVDGAA